MGDAVIVAGFGDSPEETRAMLADLLLAQLKQRARRDARQNRN